MNKSTPVYTTRLLAAITLFNREFVLETHGKLLDRSTWHPLATLRLEREAYAPDEVDYWFGPLHWTWCKLPSSDRNQA